MLQSLDPVAQYGNANGWRLRYRTVLVEGTTDSSLFQQSAHLALEETGVDLLGDELIFVAAGEGEAGGTRGVSKQLVTLRGIANNYLQPNGRPFYRFIGLYDSDAAGNKAVKGIQQFDRSIIEYKDVFNLRPIMPFSDNVESSVLRRRFDEANAEYKGLDWELEDLLPSNFVKAFDCDYPNDIRNRIEKSGKIHYEFSQGSKARFHRYIRKHAVHADVKEVLNVIRAMRCYFNLPMI